MDSPDLTHKRGSAIPVDASLVDPSVAIIVCTHNHAHFLAQALDSVFAQTRKADEIIVVDDGSDDAPELVVANYPQARLIRRKQGGLAAARNTGAAAASSTFVQFLDADDLLLDNAIADGLDAMAANPGAALVYGGYTLVDAELKPISAPRHERLLSDPYHHLLRANVIGMHGTVLYDRGILIGSGGFDAGLQSCEDYDFFLRLARMHRIAGYPRTVALYRRHGANMSSNAVRMLEWVLKVHARHRPSQSNDLAWNAWEAGERHWRRAFVNQAWRSTPHLPPGVRWRQRLDIMRIEPRLTPAAAFRQLVVKVLPDALVELLRRVRRQNQRPRRGEVDFGDLARIRPLSPGFGFRRGTPVDRWYIERFLAANRSAIRGRALEIGSDGYCARFGDAITRQDILHVNADNPAATLVGSLTDAAVLPDAAFDAMVITQTLHLIYDLPAAVRNLHAALRPGGTLLLTVPGITPISADEWGENWFWSLTAQSATRLFGDVFGPANVQVEAVGNCFAAMCLLQGVALEDVGEKSLEPVDREYPVIITVRAQRS